MTGEPGIYLRRNPDRVRAPDVCLWVKDRVPPEDDQRHFLETIPDPIVEVIFPGDSAADVQQRGLSAGARLVWAVYPDTRTVVAYRSATEIRMYGQEDVIDAAPVLPDCSCPVANFFK
jgi:Uma2 family endonuclease